MIWLYCRCDFPDGRKKSLARAQDVGLERRWRIEGDQVPSHMAGCFYSPGIDCFPGVNHMLACEVPDKPSKPKQRDNPSTATISEGVEHRPWD